MHLVFSGRVSVADVASPKMLLGLVDSIYFTAGHKTKINVPCIAIVECGTHTFFVGHFKQI